MSLKIDSLDAKNFKNLSCVSINLEGNDLILSGPNGSGKTALMEFLELLTTGQIHGMKKSDILKKDVIRHGEESAELNIRLRSGDHLKYTASIKVTKSKTKVSLFEVGYSAEDKKQVYQPITRVAEFFEKITAPYTIDPTSLREMQPQELVNLIYQLSPNLKKNIDSIDSEINAIKSERSKTKAKAEHLKELAAAIPSIIPEGYPSQRVDTDAILSQINKANESNVTYNNLTSQLKDVDRNISEIETHLSSINEYDKQLHEDAQAILNKIESLKEKRSQASSKLSNLQSSKKDIQSEIDSTNYIDTNELTSKLHNASTVNKFFDDLDRKNEFDNEVNALRLSYSELFKKMKDFEQNKLEALKAADLPIDNLFIDEGFLYVPGPDGSNVRIDTLSEGQFYTIAAELHASLIKTDGLRLIFVKNLNAMDDVSFKAFSNVCRKHNLQIVAHETIRSPESDRMGILIIDGKASNAVEN